MYIREEIALQAFDTWCVCVYWQVCKVDILARAVAITAQAPLTSPRSKLAQSDVIFASVLYF